MRETIDTTVADFMVDSYSKIKRPGTGPGL